MAILLNLVKYGLHISYSRDNNELKRNDCNMYTAKQEEDLCQVIIGPPSVGLLRFMLGNLRLCRV